MTFTIEYFSKLKVGDKFRSARYDGTHYDTERISDDVYGVNCRQIGNGLLSGVGPDMLVGKF